MPETPYPPASSTRHMLKMHFGDIPIFQRLQ